MNRIAIYIGASGWRSAYPLRDGVEAPHQIKVPSGEVRALHQVEIVETFPSVHPAFAEMSIVLVQHVSPEMAVTA